MIARRSSPPGEQLTVAGTTSTSPDGPLPTTPYRDGGHSSLRLGGTKRWPLVISCDAGLR